MENDQNMMPSNLSVILMLFTAILFGCKNNRVATENMEGMTVVTVIDSRDLDGCTFLLKTENDEYLEPMNLNDSLKTHGRKLAIRYKLSKNASICMKGKTIEITTVKSTK